ncbi:hypothetical protein ACJMK2_044230 [Sinanodonta woodiana]|uniref:Uncharacterized protein n=1 Tax=Sinanodonta woodiana TaxID=1069815 RepID=A0ABD3W177_SINWO
MLQSDRGVSLILTKTNITQLFSGDGFTLANPDNFQHVDELHKDTHMIKEFDDIKHDGENTNSTFEPQTLQSRCFQDSITELSTPSLETITVATPIKKIKTSLQLRRRDSSIIL